MVTDAERAKQPVVRRAPQDGVIAETPETHIPAAQAHFWGSYGTWLGDPNRRYGRLTSARAIPARVKLEMLRDPIIAMCMGFITATIVEAERVIECRDEGKRRFFEAMFRTWEQDFMLNVAMAVALGSIGLIKRFRYAVPQPVAVDADPVWTSRALPLILAGFDACYPLDSSPRFDDKRRHFEGMSTVDGDIDLIYSLWLTMGKARAFGAYEGSGRLENVYGDWWRKHFGRDLYLIWLQRNANPSTRVMYPPGKTGGKSHRDIAIETGNALRGGATIAMSSLPYKIADAMGVETYTAVNRWAVDFLAGQGDVGQFHRIDDHHDQKMSIGLFVPPQTFMNVKQSALGGPTTADVLTELAMTLLLMECSEADRHLNQYAFPFIDRANFPPGGARVQVRTVGLSRDSKTLLFQIMDGLLKRADIAPPVDIREGLRRLGIPVGEPVASNVLRVDIPPEDNPLGAAGMQGGGDGAGQGNPSEAVLRQMIEEPIQPLTEADAMVSNADIERAYARLVQLFPELFEEVEEESRA